MFILAVILAAAGIYDHFFRKIPNILTIFLLLGLIVITIAESGVSSLMPVLIKVSITGIVFYPLFAIGAFGAGDVKLMAVSCGFFSGTRCLMFIFLSLLIAAGIGLVKLRQPEEMRKRMCRLAMYIEQITKTGKIEKYHHNRQAALINGVAMAGPMFISALIGMGGLY